MNKKLTNLIIAVITLWPFSLNGTAGDVNMTFRFNDPKTKEIGAALNEFEAENLSVEVELESFTWS